jgi:hypothetical protein
VHAEKNHPSERHKILEKMAFRRYSEDENKITNNPMVLDHHGSKEDGKKGLPYRRHFKAGYRDRYRDRRRDPYHDLDDPANSAAQVPRSNKIVVNYLEI